MSLPATFRALVSNGDKTASVKVLNLVKDLKPDEILVRIRTVALNPADGLSAGQNQTLYGDLTVAGTILGFDASGDVVGVGSQIKQFQVGDRIASFALGDITNGAFAEYTRFNPIVTTKLPPSVSYNEGASFSVVQGCAIQGLYSRLNLPRPSNPANKQDIILVWGGSSATGHWVVQFAALSGLRVFVTASPAAHASLKELGAEACFDYKDPDVVSKIKAAAGERGIKYGYDTISKNGTGSKLVEAIGPNGGHVITLLPQPGVEEQRSDVKVDFIMVGLVLAPGSADTAAYRGFLDHELPPLLQGWVEGKGSSKLKPQKLRVLEGGLDRIVEGIEVIRQGDYGGEKLVYPIA